jgi:hypothetical protein
MMKTSITVLAILITLGACAYSLSAQQRMGKVRR